MSFAIRQNALQDNVKTINILTNVGYVLLAEFHSQMQLIG